MSNIITQPDGATPLEAEEREGLRFPHVSTRAELNELEQAGIVDGLGWLAAQSKPDVFSEAFVLALHRRLFDQVWRWAGCFRTTEKNIGVDPLYIGIELRKLLDDARFWVEHETYPPLELAARFHHRLVAIHLFPNGNGRHARIMADVILTKVLSHPAIDWSGGYALQAMNQRRKQYISALRAADAHDYNALLRFVGVADVGDQ